MSWDFVEEAFAKVRKPYCIRFREREREREGGISFIELFILFVVRSVPRFLSSKKCTFVRKKKIFVLRRKVFITFVIKIPF